MTTENQDPNQLTTVLGEIALADAEIDHWLTLMLAEVLVVEQNVVTVLVQTDASDRKAEKLKKLLHMSQAAQQHSEVIDLLGKIPRLKVQRDLALHAFYLVEDESQPLRRFRTRGETPEISIAELTLLRDEIRRLLLALEQATVTLSVDRARSGEVGELQRDCFEILASLRLHKQQDFLALCEPSVCEHEFAVALEGQGRWEPTHELAQIDPTRWPDRIQAIAKIQPHNGHVEMRLRDGRVVSGGDTGWRNVLKKVQNVSPQATRRF